MTNKIIQALKLKQLKANVTEFSPAWYRCSSSTSEKEGDRVRSQHSKASTAIRSRGLNSAFTVRKNFLTV